MNAEKFFLKQIEKYNEKSEYYNHCVLFGENVMIIKWEHNKWEYYVYPLEDPLEIGKKMEYRIKTVKTDVWGEHKTWLMGSKISKVDNDG
jgi:hypothetical protein